MAPEVELVPPSDAPAPPTVTEDESRAEDDRRDCCPDELPHSFLRELIDRTAEVSVLFGTPLPRRDSPANLAWRSEAGPSLGAGSPWL